MEPVLIYDTTLRDGTQARNINFSAEEKIKIARRLDNIGIHYIEGGWPGSNPRDREFFDLAEKENFFHARITAFGATRRPGIRVAHDPNLTAILKSKTPAAAIFGKTWDLHVELIGTSREENLDMIHESVARLAGEGRETLFDAEHFFDGYRANRDYAIQSLRAAMDGGAHWLVLCDTNGGALPHEIFSAVKDVRASLGPQAPPVGIHTHNDSGMAVANSIEGVRAGAAMVQGTVNGYGERCGNADLTSVIPVLSLKMGRKGISDENLRKLKRLSRFVSETANQVPLNARPFVGENAFAHKGGIHVSAVMKNARAYEHMDPEAVGNARHVLVSDMAGKSNILYKSRELGIDLESGGVDGGKVVQEIKNLEQQGYQFDVADGSFRILLEKLTGKFMPAFELKAFRITTEKDLDQPCHAQATIKISVDGREEITAAEGDGPVGSLDNALRKALRKFYPCVDWMHLVDFKVRVIDGADGTAAKVRVLIETRDRDKIWTTIGCSRDIIEASWQALVDSFQFKLATAPKRLPPVEV